MTTHLMAGGAPAGISILAGELGWRTNINRIRKMKMAGKSTTTPSGTDTLEFPFNLSGRLRYARRVAHVVRPRALAVFSPVTGNCWGPPAGMYLPARRRRSMAVDSAATDVLLPWVSQERNVCVDWGRWYYRTWLRMSYRKGKAGFVSWQLKEAR